LNDSQNITLKFLTEVANTKLVDNSHQIVKCYGISQNPITKNYLMVMEYIRGGNLRSFLQYNKLSFEDKLRKLSNVVRGLNVIHQQNLVHRDFHSGNILNDQQSSYITDLGLSQPINYQKEEGKTFGVLPYVAPEVLQKQPYTKASDIYSLGIVAYELFANSYPYPALDDMNLAFKICQGLRPNIDEVKIPQLLKDLIKRC
jgi:serine/threonine protein kinase